MNFGSSADGTDNNLNNQFCGETVVAEPSSARETLCFRPPRSFGPYQVIDRLGSGGMGLVLRARDKVSGEVVAIKTVKAVEAALLIHLRMETQALLRLDHPSIVKIIDHGVEEGIPWYAMPLIEGTSISVLRPIEAARETPMVFDATLTSLGACPAPGLQPEVGPFTGAGLTGAPLLRLLRVMRRLCDPLAHIHDAGMVHRDLKPENIFLTAGDAPVVFDFGLAHSKKSGSQACSAPSHNAGTPRYMAPEQHRGQEVDVAADIFAFGAIFFELLTGVRWTAGMCADRLPLTCEGALSLLLAAMLDDDPARRPCAASVARRLDHHIACLSAASSRVDSPAPRPRRRVRLAPAERWSAPPRTLCAGRSPDLMAVGRPRSPDERRATPYHRDPHRPQRPWRALRARAPAATIHVRADRGRPPRR